MLRPIVKCVVTQSFLGCSRCGRCIPSRRQLIRKRAQVDCNFIPLIMHRLKLRILWIKVSNKFWDTTQRLGLIWHLALLFVIDWNCFVFFHDFNGTYVTLLLSYQFICYVFSVGFHNLRDWNHARRSDLWWRLIKGFTLAWWLFVFIIYHRNLFEVAGRAFLVRLHDVFIALPILRLAAVRASTTCTFIAFILFEHPHCFPLNLGLQLLLLLLLLFGLAFGLYKSV